MAIIDSLVSYWSLDEASGNRADSHGSNALTANGAPGNAAGKVGNAVDLEEGSSQSLSCSDPASLSGSDRDFTIQAWVNLESKAAGYHGIVAKWGIDNTLREYLLAYKQSTDRFVLLLRSASATLELEAGNFGAPDIATWYHIVVWHSAAGDVGGIVVNAGTPNTAAHSTGVQDTTQDFQIGRQSSTYFDGLIDEVGFWDRVLTSDERTWLYNSGNGRSYAEIVAESGHPAVKRMGGVRFAYGGPQFKSGRMAW